MLMSQRKLRIGSLFPVKVTEVDGARLFRKHNEGSSAPSFGVPCTYPAECFCS